MVTDTGYGVLRPTRQQVRAWRTKTTRWRRRPGLMAQRFRGTSRAFARKTKHRIKSIVIASPPLSPIAGYCKFLRWSRCNKALYDQGSRLLSRYLRLTKPAFYAAINVLLCSTLVSSLSFSFTKGGRTCPFQTTAKPSKESDRGGITSKRDFRRAADATVSRSIRPRRENYASSRCNQFAAPFRTE